MNSDKKSKSPFSAFQVNYYASFNIKYGLLQFILVLLCISCESNKVKEIPSVAIVTWDDSAKEGRDEGSIRVYQLGEPVNGLNVKVEFEGTASDGFDYRSNNNEFVVNKYKEIRIKPISDGLTEGNERVIIRLVPSEDYIIDKEHSKASLVILDDAVPDIEFEMPGSINIEANENAEIQLKLSEVSNQEIKFSYSVQGVLAEQGLDFVFDSYSAIIPPGEDEVALTFRVNDDTIVEDDETVVVRLTNATNANIGEMESHYYTIKNDDGAPIRSSVHDKIYGALLGFRAGCSMGAITEYNWPQDRIQEIFGFLDTFLPYKHYSGAWTHPAGATEDGGERHKLITTAIIEKQDRINYQDLKKVWLRDAEIGDMYHMTQNYDRILLTLKESKATFKVIISATPILGPDRQKKNDNHSNEGFKTEGDEVRNFFNQFDNLFLCVGDRHWQYVSHIEDTNLWEFSCGPGSDMHAGGWKQEYVLPEHKFLRVKGGFLRGEVYRENNIPNIKFQHYDVDGNVVNEKMFKSELTNSK